MFFEYLIIILFILIIIITKKKFIKYFFIGAVYLLAIVYSLELLTTLFLENKHLPNYTLRTNKLKSLGFKDFRNNYEAFYEERQKFDIYPVFRLAEHHLYRQDKNNLIKNLLNKRETSGYKVPLRAPLNKLSLGDNEDGIREIVFNDTHGFTNPNSVYKKKIDIMILGDSFAEGIPFDENNNVSGIIRNLSNYNAINLGVSGSGPLVSLAALKEYGNHLKPKKVFYFFYERNDFSDMMSEKDTFLIKYLKNFNQDLFNSKNEINLFMEEYNSIFEIILADKISKSKKTVAYSPNKNQKKISEIISDFFELRNTKKIFLTSPLFSKTKIDYSLFKKILEEMSTEVKNFEADLYFVYLPSWSRYNNKYSLMNYFFKKKVLSYVKKVDIAIIDIDEYIKDEKIKSPIDLYNFSLSGHFNNKGYTLISKKIINELRKK